MADKNNADDCSVVGKENDLRAFVGGDDTWNFRDDTTLSFGSETLTFGVGTVGNNSFSPNGFNGAIVDGMDYSLYAGDVTTSNLDGQLLTTGSITFTWSGATGFDDADIRQEVVFRLGTQPDSFGFIPEPGTGLLLGMGLVGLAAYRRRA